MVTYTCYIVFLFLNLPSFSCLLLYFPYPILIQFDITYLCTSYGPYCLHYLILLIDINCHKMWENENNSYLIFSMPHSCFLDHFLIARDPWPCVFPFILSFICILLHQIRDTKGSVFKLVCLVYFTQHYIFQVYSLSHKYL